MGTEKPARFTAWRAFLCSIAAGAAGANRGAGGTVGEDGDPGEIAKRLVAFRAVRRGIQIAPSGDLDIASHKLGPLVMPLQEGDRRGQQVGEADAGRLRQAVVCLPRFGGNDG